MPRKVKETANGSGTKSGDDAAGGRRGFFTRVAAIAIGALITLFPFAAGLFVFADPLRRGGAARSFVKVTTLESVPADGIPRAFPVVTSRSDAWTFFPDEPIGAVFLRRQQGTGAPEAFQTTCPHAGCMLDFANTEHKFKCPCHNSSFQPDGAIIQPSPAPRPMDSLACEVRDNQGVQEVWVLYENFYTGVAEKTAKT